MDTRLLDKAIVIWDLDGTFWDGTISEEGATFRRDNLDVVVELSKHGIVSSIMPVRRVKVV